MNAFILIIGGIFVVVLLTIFSIDFVFYVKDRFSRYHIGKWDNKDWKNAVIERAKRWSVRLPIVKKTDNSRYIIFDMINGVYKDSSIQAWQNGSLLIGLLELKQAGISFGNQFINEEGKWRAKRLFIDSGMTGYAVLKSDVSKEKIRPAMDMLLDVIYQATDTEGLISYTGNKDNPERYVDTLGMVCPFLALYGRAYNVASISEMAYKQIEFYHEYGLLKNTSLPNHAINEYTKLPLGVFGWGRGIGWYVIALIDTYKELTDIIQRQNMLQWIEEAAESYLNYQRDDGGFGSIIQREKTYDSSATAVLAWFYYECAILFNERKYIDVADKALVKLKSVTRRDGAIDWCQGDTKGIGIFATTYDIMPFAQGFTVRAIALKERLRI